MTLDVYTARVVSGAVVLEEHRDGRWIGADEVGSLDWAEADVPVLEPLRRMLARSDVT